MPTITHAIIGGAIGLILFTFSRNQSKQFKPEHVILLALNNFIGPDWAKFLSPFYGENYWSSDLFRTLNGFSHSIIGWLLTALLLTPIYYSIFRFVGEGKRNQKSPISILHMFLLICAAGIMHFGVDMLDGAISLLPVQISTTWKISLETFQTGYSMAEGILWNKFSWFDDKFLLVIGVLVMFILIWMMKNKPVKWVWITASLFGVFIYLTIWLIGSSIVANENDLGYFLYFCFSWIGPLLVCILCFDPIIPNIEILPTDSTSSMELEKNPKVEVIQLRK